MPTAISISSRISAGLGVERFEIVEGARVVTAAARTSLKPIRVAIGSTVVDPNLLRSAERLQYEGYLRREETNAVVAGLAAEGVPVKELVRRAGRSRGLVPQIFGERTDVCRTRQESLDPHLHFLDTPWATGCRNGAELWRRLRGLASCGSTRVVSEWATRRRRSERTTTDQLRKVPSAQSIDRMMTLKRDHLTKVEAVTVTAIEAGAATFADARALIDRFQAIIRGRAVVDLDP